jgi:hypothetical protein
LIFLGSGSSVPFGLPTMRDLVKSFEEELLTITKSATGKEMREMLTLYRDIKKKLEKVYQYVDMESVFSVVDMISKDTLYSQLDFGSMYILSTKGNITNGKIFTELQGDHALELLRMYREHVRKECTLKHDYDDDINTIYKEFFGKIRDESKEERLYIYTTNYDRVLETYWEDKEINDLFVPRGGLQQFDRDRLIDGNYTKLVKLHGSIDWFKLDDGRIVRSHDKRMKIAGKVVEGEIMLYPIQQKDLYAYPWLDIFRQFKEDLKNAKNWIVLGYSFNDEYVKAMFLEVLKDANFKHKLIIVHPHVKEIGTKFDGKQDHIIYIKAKLGENETVPKILEALRISNMRACCVI